MDNNSTQQEKNEIDLSQVSNTFKKGINNTLSMVSQAIKFIKEKFIILLLLVIVGSVGGSLYAKYNKKYESQIIVTPNFNTVDYLYEQVTLINSKIQQKDVEFLTKVGIVPSSEITQIEIEPITGLYKFLIQEDNYFEIFKILSENNDAKKVAEDPSTSKYFTNHQITVSSNAKVNQKVLENIMKYINSSKFYETFRADILQNLKDKIVSNEATVLQIDGILNKAGSATTGASSISVNGESQWDKLVEVKTDLIQENHELKVHKHTLKYIVTPLDYAANIEDKKSLYNKYYIVFPMMLVALFIVFTWIRKLK